MTAFLRPLLRLLIGLVAGASVFGAALAADRVGEKDIKLGDPHAPVTVIEYASVTCPHCARFNANVYPALKARYIDTGKVLYIFREFPTEPVNIAAAGFLIARCSGPDHYLAVVDALFRAQEAMFTSHDVHAFLLAGAKAGGLSEDEMKACISDASALQAFNARAEKAAATDHIQATPTVLVNGKPVDSGTHEIAIADIDAALAPLLASAPKPAVRRSRGH